MPSLCQLLKYFSAVTAFSALVLVASAESQLSSIYSAHPPELKMSSSDGFLSESAEMGTTVRVAPMSHSDPLRIVVHDPDLKTGMAAVTYEYILTGLGATIFAVDQQGFVYLDVPAVDADPPHPSSYDLFVQAREMDTIPIRASEPVKLTVHILDVNDNAPTFRSPIYIADVSADGAERPVVQIYAEDNDTGELAAIKYRITSVTNGALSNFFYNATERQLMVKGQLVPSEIYQVILEARDGGGLWSEAIVIVAANGEPRSPLGQSTESFRLFPTNPLQSHSSHSSEDTSSGPHGTPSEAVQTFVTEISEAAPPHSIVLTLGDGATRGRAFFSITGGNQAAEFAIDEETGTITTTGTFDREHTPMYNLQIEAMSRSPAQHLYWTVVQVAVLDVNDNAPEFVDPMPIRLLTDFTGMETLRPNMVVGRITVRDRDSQDNGHVRLRIAPPMDRLFSITDDGTVMVNGNITSAHFGEHRAEIVAKDHGDPPLESRAIALITLDSLQNSRAPVNTNMVSNSTDRVENPEKAVIRVPWLSGFTTALPLQKTITDGTHPNNPALEVLSIGASDKRPFAAIERSFANYETSAVAAAQSTVQPFHSSTIKSSPVLARLAPVFDPSTATVSMAENARDRTVTQLFAHYPDGLPGPITFVLVAGDSSLFTVDSKTGAVDLLRPLNAKDGSSQQIHVSTAEAMELPTDADYAHSAVVSVEVSGGTERTPYFELNSYTFRMQPQAPAGSVIGQVHAFSRGTKEPANEITYRLIKPNGSDKYFDVNSETGMITVKKYVHVADIGKNIMLTIEASEAGSQRHAGRTTVMITADVTVELLPNQNSANTHQAIKFTRSNYTTSTSEEVAPPHLVLVIPVENKPSNRRFIACSILSGNYKGAFGISTTADGNCELRTQMKLDRRSVERYLLNVSVASERQSDSALVGVAVLDHSPPNAFTFVFDNQLSLPMYFAGVASDAPAFTHVLDVKTDIAANRRSNMLYSLDSATPDSQFFSVDRSGRVSTKISMAHLLEDDHKAAFNLKVKACDSTEYDETLCREADVVVNVVQDVHRFIMTITSHSSQQILANAEDISKTVRHFTGNCSLVFIEKTLQTPEKLDGDKTFDIQLYAVNPKTRSACHTLEFRNMFNTEQSEMLKQRLRPRIELNHITDALDLGGTQSNSSGVLSSKLSAPSIALMVVALAIAIGALFGIFAICICYSRQKSNERSVHTYPTVYPVTKLGTVFSPHGNLCASRDKLYETQMLELPIGDEALRNSMYSTRDCSTRQTYHSDASRCSRNNGEGDFSIEESMYAVNVAGRIDPVTKRVQTLVIPAPDYDSSQKKSIL